MHDASQPKAGADNYDRFMGTGMDTADPLGGSGEPGASHTGIPENWSTWPGNGESALGPHGIPEDADNTAFGRIDIPV